MTISAGSRLGPYEIVAPLGAGGMGEVYRARDTRLQRDVAVKVLPAHLSSSSEMKQRFEREAKAISRLSHPHICALYDVGSHEGVEYLVMEYLEGETLGARLARGPIPLEQTLRFGVEIADALDRAHRQGIVHRDLKPANVMLTKSGVKLLDFGLARTVAPVDGSAAGMPTAASTELGTPELTEKGTILGTFQYMAPEQLERGEADGRSDIFALGSVLYEMATGRKAFTGSSRASLISAILRDEPSPISQVQPLSPPSFDRVVRKCLAKDPEERWQNAADLGSELAWIREGWSQSGARVATPAAKRVPSRLWPIVAALAVAAAAVVAWRATRGAKSAPAVVHAAIPPPAGTAYWLELNSPGPAVLSPRGDRLAFTAGDPSGTARLYVRSLATGDVTPLAGTEGAQYPFWSPDGRSIGFFGDGKLRTIEASGGPALTICPAAEGKGGSWSPAGVIVFAPDATTGIAQVPEKGGTPKPVTRLDEKRGDDSHRHPRFLPDGRRFLYLARSPRSPGDGQAIVAASIDGGAEKVVLRSPSMVEYADGYLVYMRETALVARPFDAGKLEFTGEAVPLAEQIFSPAEGTAIGVFSAAPGVLTYLTGHGETGTRLRWFSRDGKPQEIISEAAAYRDVALSPDGKQAAVSIRDPSTGTHDLWIFDLVRGIKTRFTFDPADDRTPVWSPDSAYIVFSSNRKGHYDLYRKAVGGSTDEEPVLVSTSDKMASSWSGDGKFLLFAQFDKDSTADAWYVRMDGPHEPLPVLTTKALEFPAALSPDGRWMLYTSDESGGLEIYATSFPRPGRKWQVSPAGGVYSYWSADGKEILYQRNDGQLWAVPVEEKGDGLELGRAARLFWTWGPLAGGPSFSPTRDHQRILVVASGREPNANLDLVVNWRQLVGAKR